MHLTLQRLFKIMAVGAMALSSCVVAEVEETIPLKIKQVISRAWDEGSGMYRVIVPNTEIDPCLVLESINLSENKVLSSTKLCPSGMKIKDYYAKDRDLMLSNDLAGFFYDEARFDKGVLLLTLDISLNRGPNFLAKCRIKTLNRVYQAPVCKKYSNVTQ